MLTLTNILALTIALILTITYCLPNYNCNRNTNPQFGKNELRTLRTQDTSDPGHFGTSLVGPNWCRSVLKTVRT